MIKHHLSATLLGATLITSPQLLADSPLRLLENPLAQAKSTFAADDEFTQTRVLELTPVTGINQFCGQRLWSFAEQRASLTEFASVAAYQDDAERPTLLTTENCTADQVLATYHDPVLSFDPPGPIPAAAPQPDVRLENIPLRDVPKTPSVIAGGTFNVRTFLSQSDVTPANPFPTRAPRNRAPITLGSWAEATGRMSFSCRADGTGRIWGSFRKLVQRGLYTVWGSWRTTDETGNSEFVVPAAIGELPNTFTANRRGSAFFDADLDFCPAEETQNGSLLLYVSIVYHPDAVVYGAALESAEAPYTFIMENGETFQSNTGYLMSIPHLNAPVNFTESFEFEGVSR